MSALDFFNGDMIYIKYKRSINYGRYGVVKKIGKAKLTVDFTERHLFLRNTGYVFFADASKVTYPTTVIPSESEDDGGVEPPMDQVLDSLAKSVGILLAEQDMDEDEAEAAFNGFRTKIVTEYQKAKNKRDVICTPT